MALALTLTVLLALAAPMFAQEIALPPPSTLDRLRSPLLAERLAAIVQLREHGLAGADSLFRKALGNSSRAMRARASAYFARIQTEGHHSLLAAAMANEDDPGNIRELAMALAKRGRCVLETLSRDDIGEAKFSLFAAEYVIFSLEAVIETNTGVDGIFKGFYDGQFDEVSAIGPAGDGFLAASASNPDAADLLRRAAVRAFGDSRARRHTQTLEEIRRSFVRERRIGDVRGLPVSMLDPDQLDLYFNDVLLEYLDYAAARCGDSRGLVQRVEYHRERQRLLELQMRAFPAERREIRPLIADELFRIAYAWQQARDFERARRHYRLICRDYASSGVTATAWYNLACMSSRAGQAETALKHLKRAVASGYSDFEWMLIDQDLLEVRKLPSFENWRSARLQEKSVPEPPPMPGLDGRR